MVGPDLFDLHAKWHNKVANLAQALADWAKAQREANRG